MDTQRTCAVSGKTFSLSQHEVQHYAKVGLPLPRLCPEERLRRRLLWRNDRTFYKRSCDACKKTMISMYPERTRFPVYCAKCWWSDKNDPMQFGRAFDFQRGFFEQYGELIALVPRLGMDLVNCENSDYCNYCGDDKNCYFDIAGEANEDCYFNLFTKYSKNCLDCTFVYKSTLCYESLQCRNSYHCFFSISCADCADLSFCYDMKGCRDCIFSHNLRNKEYCIMNVQYSKEEYLKKKSDLALSSYEQLEKAFTFWRSYKQLHAIHRATNLTNTENCSGDEITNSRNTNVSFNATNCEDSGYLYDVLDAKDCYDLNYSLYKPELSTELISTLQMTRSAYSLASHYCDSIFYSDMCNNSQNLFGCIGLNRKQYCILNRQYSSEEYENLKRKIIHHMQKTDEWGLFFPSQLSPHAYNETVAQEYLPLSKQEAHTKGFQWKDIDPKESEPPTGTLADRIQDIPDSITDGVLGCIQCKKNYRIVVQEVAFYRNQELPVPRLCPGCRHLRRNSLQNPRTLAARLCSQCSTPVQSTFAPNAVEKVYCEGCYLRTIY